ncbi:hypothetical protein [Rahnella ecdela]|uniref:Uncharacterized protein n=1 Tax=Rahnella ecdela TaxID=2816250 RepID=A0ABS6LGD1_9GAMM|nr:hypothetical protein [Rahnella ecdela]MBU9845818.1 hypothetical protein [Rahnella ecdela]
MMAETGLDFSITLPIFYRCPPGSSVISRVIVQKSCRAGYWFSGGHISNVLTILIPEILPSSQLFCMRVAHCNYYGCTFHRPFTDKDIRQKWRLMTWGFVKNAK